MIRISTTKQQKILKLYKEGVSIKAIAKQVKSDWRTVKKIVSEQKPQGRLSKNPNYYDELLGTIPKDLAEAQAEKNKRRSEILHRMNSDPLVSGRAIAERQKHRSVEEAQLEDELRLKYNKARRLLDKITNRLLAVLEESTENENT